MKASVLTRRDHEILRFIGQGWLASLDQLHRKFWAHATPITTYERMRELVRAGVVERKTVHLRKAGELVYVLTRLGAAEFPYPERQKFIIGLPARHELKQQLLAQDARLILERNLANQELHLVDWLNERELRRISGREGEIPDARAIIQDNQGGLSELDFEIDGAYYSQMLKAKLRDFGKSGKQLVWVTTPGRVARIRREIQRLGAVNIQLLALP